MCQNASRIGPQQQMLPTIVNGGEVITDDAADAIADLLLGRWFSQQTQPVRDGDSPRESDSRSTESAP